MLRLVLSRCQAKLTQCQQNLQLIREFSSSIDYNKLVNNKKVVLFMKGTPDKPRCGYSHGVVKLLDAHGIEYEHHDVLANQELREGIKAFSDWPTIPQIYIDGKFIGGYDILVKLHRTGVLNDVLKSAGIKSVFYEEQNKKHGKKNDSSELS